MNPITTQGTITPEGVVNFDPNTGKRLATGQSVQVAAGGNTYGSTVAPTPQVTASTPQISILDAYKMPQDEYGAYSADPLAYEKSKGLSVDAEKASLATELQQQIDASNALYANKLREAKIIGEARLGATRSGELSRGTVGGNVATAQVDQQTNVNQAEYNDIEQQRMMAANNLRIAVDKIAQDRYDKKSLAMSGNVKDRVAYLKGLKDEARTNSEAIADQLISMGVDPTTLDKGQLKDAGLTLADVQNAFAVKQYAAKKAKEEADKKISDASLVRAEDQANRIALEKEKAAIEAGKPFNLPEGQKMFRINPKTGQYEIIATNPKASTSGTTGTGTTGTFDIKTLSPQAQSYINAIQRGDYGSLEEALKGIGTTKAALNLKNEIIVGYNALAGGKEGTKLITQPEAANFERMLSNIKNVDVTAYGGIDTPGGLLSGIANPTTSAYIDNILGNLTLDKRQLLKGSGAISDKENAMLADSVSILSRKNISEVAAKQALKDIEDILNTKINNYYSQTSQSRPGGETQTPVNPQAESLRTKYNY
jgi:hypothetical protein